MANAYLDWLGGQADRDLARQRAQVDTAKLLATFSAAVAVTLVATALQVGQSASGWDKIAVVGLAASFVAVLLVIMSDRTSQVDHQYVVSQSVLHGWSQAQLATKLRVATIAAVTSNERPVRVVLRITTLQVVISAASAGAAIMSLV